jgi:trans-aconitate methyltransferase
LQEFAMSERQAHWERVYTSNNENEVSWFQANPATSVELIRATGATGASAIIDIGGGTSRLVDVLLRAGFRSIAVLDLSGAALAAARARLGADASHVDWIVSDVTQWTPTQQYDVWHDRAAFHFLTEPADRAAYLARLREALKPRGHVIIGTFAADGPEKCSGLPVQRYDAAGLQETLGSDFELLAAHRETHTTPWRSTQSFQFARFRRLAAGGTAAQ